MKKLTIFVDMDGTIERLLEVWIARLNKRHGLNITIDDVTCWDMTRVFSELTPEEVFEPFSDDSIWHEIEPMEGAGEVLEEWIKSGHRVYIVTASQYESLKAKMDGLLFRCFPFIRWENVIIIENKQLLKGDVMIDDGLHNLIGGDYEKILFDAPYNRTVDDKLFGLTRVKSWAEVRAAVAGLCE